MSHHDVLQIIILIPLILLLTSTTTSQSQPTQFIFNDFSNAGSTISLQNSAELTHHNKIIQLTNTTNRVMGHAFYATPFKFKPSGPKSQVSSFSTAFTFGTVPEFQTKLGGHGMAFVMAPSIDRLTKALPSQYLGLFNAGDIGNATNHVFAVEFDTVQDFEFGDINDNHVGIDLNNLASNISFPSAFYLDNSTKVNVTLKEGKTIQAWVDYDSITNLINVTISPFSTKPEIPLISYKYNLSEILNEYMYIGFAGSTGLLSSSHYVLGWSFNMSGPAMSLSSMPPLPLNPVQSTNNRKAKLAVGLSVSLTTFFILVLFGVAYLVKKIRDMDVIEDWELTIGPHRYTYQELKQATRGFKETELLGRGGFGRVYKGTLPKCNTQIAVKRISHESRQGLKEFVAEIASIGRLRHRNLVQLLGWCRRRGDLLLVYDYMPYGSLEKCLFDQRGYDDLVLSWEQRFKIIKGVAHGLLYLHEGWEKVVIHRDIKASNVLLDAEFDGRLGDFGLARLHDRGTALGTTRVVGTLGYIAPELSRTGHVTTNSDVFAFGALLLEVVCGRSPIEPKAGLDELVLVDWVWAKWKDGNVMDVVDPRLKGKFDSEEVMGVIKVGMMCSSDEPRARPSMSLVMRYLDREVSLPEVLRAPSLDDNRSSIGEHRLEDYVYSLATSSSGLSLQSCSNGNGVKHADGYAGLNTTTVSSEERQEFS